MEKVELGKVCKIRNGFAFKSTEFKTKGVPLLRISNFDDGDVFINKRTVFVEEKFLEDKKDFIVEKGDVLIALSGATTGKFGVYNYDFPSLLNQRIGLLKSGLSKELSSNYFYYYLNVLKREILSQAGGAAQPNISTKAIGELKIPLPSLETQKKIAAILDEADKLRQLDKQLIEKYDALTQSLFLDMFGDPVTNPKGWNTINLGSVCGVGSSRRVFVDELVEDGIPFYRGTEVGKLGEGKSIIPTLFITRNHYESLKAERGIPKQGDLLMPSICPDGRIWVVDNDKEFYFKDGRVLWVEVDSKTMNSIYLRYHLKGSFFANYNNIASGTTFAELKIVALKKMTVFYPDIKLQNQFAERVQAIEAQKALAQQSLEKSEELFNSLLQKAFKGELV